MALPTKSKTWTIRSNIAVPYVGDYVAHTAAWYLEWKNSLKTLGATVSGSSNGSTSGMDGVDRWVTFANVVSNYPGSAHSWIVLRFPNIAPKFEILLSRVSNNNGWNRSTSWVSPAAGFGLANGGINGSVTVDPTATDGRVYQNPGNEMCCGDELGYTQSRCHFWADSTQTFYYFARTINSVCGLFGFFGLVPDPPSEWLTGTKYVYGTQCSVNGAYNGAHRSYWHNQLRIHSKVNAVDAVSYLTGEMLANQLISTYQNFPAELNVGYPIGGVGLYSTTAAARGKLGTMPDLYWGAESNILTGDTFPNDATRTWIQIGNFILPWDGSVPIVAN
jgi:hypothetical protein